MKNRSVRTCAVLLSTLSLLFAGSSAMADDKAPQPPKTADKTANKKESKAQEKEKAGAKSDPKKGEDKGKAK